MKLISISLEYAPRPLPRFLRVTLKTWEWPGDACFTACACAEYNSWQVRLELEAMVEKRYLRLSLLLTALMLIAISISVVNGQPSGERLIYESDSESKFNVFFFTVNSVPLTQWRDNPQ